MYDELPRLVLLENVLLVVLVDDVTLVIVAQYIEETSSLCD